MFDFQQEIQEYIARFNFFLVIIFNKLLPYVSIVVYDVSGQIVDVLVDDYKQAGNYNVIWNAQNHSSGIYFVSMNANGNHFTQKLMLVK